MQDAAIQIREDTAPDFVRRATRGATSHVIPRRAVIRFLAGDDHNPCPPTP